MVGRFALLTLLGTLAFTSSAQAEDFALQHQHSGVVDARAEGNVTFAAPDDGGATINITVTDNDADGWCGQAWVRSNLPQQTVRACNVAAQKTTTINLPGGLRCNVSFVEVQIGRIDPSNGDAIELGPAQRFENPCPPPATPVPAPPPPPPPPPIDAPVDYDWTAYRNWTQNDRLLVREVPPGAAVELRCRGKGCPVKRRTIAVRNGTADMHRLFRGHRVRPGAVLEVRVTRADLVGKLVRFKFRHGHTPIRTRYCLPVGSTKATHC